MHSGMNVCMYGFMSVFLYVCMYALLQVKARHGKARQGKARQCNVI